MNPSDVFSADASSSKSASPDTNVEGFYIPDDFFLHEQWSLFNFGQPVGGRVTGTKDADIFAPEAWSITRGSPDVIVAVLDSGIDYDHPDLEPNIWTNPGETGGGKESNGIDDDGNGYVDDWRGWDFADGDNDASDGRAGSIIDNSDPMAHGTAVASVIAAAGDNEIGMTGVAPAVRILPLRIIGSGIDDADAAEAAAYAVETGARVVNLSFGTFVPGFGGFPKLSEVIAASPDVLFIAAAGNSGNDSELMRTEPCVLPHPNIVCVAATDQDDNLADFASGGSNFSGAVVDIAAPGANMLVAQPPYETVFTEDFETPIEGRWNTGGDKDTWGLSDSAVNSGSYSLSDSPGGDYEAGEARWARMTEPVDLTGKSDCLLEFYVRADLGNADLLALETSGDGSRWSLRVGAYGFSMVGSTDGEFERHSVLLTLEAGREVYFGFRLRDLPNTPSGDGVYIDDMTITCQSSTYDDRQFAYAEGTSFATPLVSGVAALLLSDQPDLSADQVKQAIMDSVDPVPALEGKTVSGGRLNAYKALVEARSIASGDTAPGGPAASHTSASDFSAPTGGFVENMVLPIIKMFVPDSRGGDVPSGGTGEGAGAGEPGEAGAGEGGAGEPGEVENADAVSPPDAAPRGEAAEIAPPAPPGSGSGGPGGIPLWLWAALGGTVAAAGTAAYTVNRKLQAAAETVEIASGQMVKDATGFLTSASDLISEAAKQIVGVPIGALKQVGETLVDIHEVAKWLVRTVNITDLETFYRQYRDNDMAMRHMARHPEDAIGAVWEGIIGPIQDDWESGRQGEAFGRGLFEFVMTFGTLGLFQTTKLSKLRLFGNTGKTFDKIDDLTNAGKVRNSKGIHLPENYTNLNEGRQNTHIKRHNHFEPTKSELTHPNPAELIEKYAGTGVPKRGKFGEPNFKEVVDFGEEIGIWKPDPRLDPQGSGLPTTKGTIHYGKNGAHIVPAYPE